MTPYLMGRLQGEARLPKRNGFEHGTQAYEDYETGYQRGRAV